MVAFPLQTIYNHSFQPLWKVKKKSYGASNYYGKLHQKKKPKPKKQKTKMAMELQEEDQLWRSFSRTLQMIPAGGWKWKWSNNVLKSEMGKFWRISITNNVKSYKKFDGKAQTAKFTVFAREISSAVQKTWKTRKTKTWITQNIQILNHIQGTAIGKLTSRGFRKCGTFWVYDFLKGSYWLSKSSKISKKKMGRRRCYKKKELPQFWFFGPETNSQGNS